MRTPHRKPRTYDRVMRAAAVVLAGGRSVRMGSAKAALPWHGSTLLRHVCGLVGRGVDGPVLVVRAPGQALPALPNSVEVLDDPSEGLGPLQGIAVGLAALEDRADVAFVCGTDVPFLHPEFVRRVVRAGAAGRTRRVDVVLPIARGHAQPFAAAYRPALAVLAAKLVAADRLRPAFLFDECSVLRLDGATRCWPTPDLRAADPAPRLGRQPERTRRLHGGAGPTGARGSRCSASGASAHASGRGAQPCAPRRLLRRPRPAGVTWDRHVLAAVNGDQTGRDGDLPWLPGILSSFSRRRRADDSDQRRRWRRRGRRATRRLFRPGALVDVTKGPPRCSSFPTTCCATTSVAPASARGC